MIGKQEATIKNAPNKSSSSVPNPIAGMCSCTLEKNWRWRCHSAQGKNFYVSLMQHRL